MSTLFGVMFVAGLVTELACFVAMLWMCIDDDYRRAEPRMKTACRVGIVAMTCALIGLGGIAAIAIGAA